MFSPRILIATKAQLVTWAFVVLFIVGIHPARAEELRQYSYDSIKFSFQVNADTSVRVEETQTYRFVGEYHQGWRSLPKKGFDDLTDVTVREGIASTPLEYSSRRLNKTDPASWGKYTTFTENGQFIIEWYYNARDTTKAWTLGYTLHGAITFSADYDELYWNLFTDFDVPIGSVDATVLLPEASADHLLRESLYVEGVRGAYGSRHDTRSFHFFANDIEPYAKVTIAPGWPKGITVQEAYWRWFFWRHALLMVSFLILMVSVLAVAIHWYRTEKRPEQLMGPVIAEYTPPQNLRPAMASVVLFERVLPAVWPATLIDLAVRGHIRIKEEDSPGAEWAIRFFRLLMRMFIPLVFLGFVFWTLWEGVPYQVLLILWGLPVGIILLRVKGAMKIPRKFKLERINNENDPLEDYEQKLLDIFFPGSSITRDIPGKSGNQVAQGLQNLKRDICLETAADTQAYERSFISDAVRTKFAIRIMGGVVVTVFAIVFSVTTNYFQLVWLLMTLYWCYVGLTWFLFHDPLLSSSGRILKKDWLGFKLYLKTAEQYRLQNLTPETFEKYLPYAVLLGVEKQWSKAFDGILVEPPAWYHQTSSSSHVAQGGFSPSIFSASFISSVSQAASFSSSGGGGASGGGGSAGGGGGGGGGGAS